MKYLSKYCLYSCFLLSLFSCSEKNDNNNFVFEKFIIDTTTVKFKFSPRDIIKYKNGYLCNVNTYGENNQSLIFLNDDFSINETFSKKLNNGLIADINAIWTSNDTLFAVHGFRFYDVRYWTNDKWTVIDTNSMNRETYMHHELNYPIYEDKDFIITSCCRGEFGGAIFFKDKKNGKTYSCKATCLVGIQKIDNSYYVVSSLAHMYGSSQIIKIDNPRNLYEIKNETQLYDCSWYDIYSDNSVEIDHPKGHDKGYTVLLDTFSVQILGTFEHKNQQYHIYSDENNTYVGYLKDSKITPLDTICNKTLWMSRVRDLKHNADILPFHGQNALRGIIELNQNKIKLINFSTK